VSNSYTRVDCTICNDGSVPIYVATAWGVTSNGYFLTASNCWRVLNGVRYQGPISLRSSTTNPTHATVIEAR